MGNKCEECDNEAICKVACDCGDIDVDIDYADDKYYCEIHKKQCQIEHMVLGKECNKIANVFSHLEKMFMCKECWKDHVCDICAYIRSKKFCSGPCQSVC